MRDGRSCSQDISTHSAATAASGSGCGWTWWRAPRRRCGSVRARRRLRRPRRVHRTRPDPADRLPSTRRWTPPAPEADPALRPGDATSSPSPPGRRHVQPGRSPSEIRPGEFTFYDAPARTRSATTRRTGRARVSPLHRGLDPARRAAAADRKRMAALFGGRMSGSEGIGALLAQFLLQITGHPEQYHAADASRLGAVGPGPGHHAARAAPGRRGRGAHRGPPTCAASPRCRRTSTGTSATPTLDPAGRRRRPPHLAALAAPALRGRGDHGGVVHPGPAAGPVPA